MKQGHQIDTNDVQYIEKRFGAISVWYPGIQTKEHIHPHVTRAYTESGLVSVFHIKPIYYETHWNTWRPLSEICTHHGNKKITLKPEAIQLMSPRFMVWLQKRQRILGSELLIDYGYMSFGLQPRHMMYGTVTTVYPDPSPETTSVDGHVGRLASDLTWSAARNTADGTVSGDSDATVYLSSEFRSGTSAYEITRGYYLFDTSSITDTDSIDSGTFSLMNLADNSATEALGLIQTSPASDTAIATGDYDALTLNTPTEGATRVSSFTNNTYMNFTLNASGLSWVSKTGISKYGIRFAGDIDDSSPGARSYRSVAHAETASTTSDPKLAITHSTVASSNSYSPSGGVAYSGGLQMY